MILFISLLAGVSILLFVFGYYLLGRKDELAVRDRVLGFGQGGNGAEIYWQQQMKRPLLSRLFGPLADDAAATVEKWAPTRLYDMAVERVEEAGDFPGGRVGFFSLIGLSVLICVGGGAFYIVSHSLPTHTVLGLVALLLAIGVIMPFAYIRHYINVRREKIRHALPDVLDLLCVSVQAGLGFDAAVGRVTAKMRGPLIDEMQRLLQEQRMGIARHTAMQRLAKRCGIQEMQLFTAAIIQSERLGVGLAQVLEIQSQNMRDWRRQRSREAAAKLPIKLLFPIVFFILPAIVVVAVGPALASLAHSLSQIKDSSVGASMSINRPR